MVSGAFVDTSPQFGLVSLSKVHLSRRTDPLAIPTVATLVFLWRNCRKSHLERNLVSITRTGYNGSLCVFYLDRAY